MGLFLQRNKKGVGCGVVSCFQMLQIDENP